MRHDLYPLLQSAYHKFHSKEKVLLKVQNAILLSMDRQHVTLLVLLDFSAAFDTIDRIFWISWCLALGLLAVLLNGFPCILTTEPNWEGVFQTVCHNHRGVPQGSCLGPLILTTYASKLLEVLWGHLPDVHAYADDTQLYLSFKPNSDVNQYDTNAATELYVKAICNWILAEKLNLNDDNTELFW